MHVGTTALENVHYFEYLGAKLQCHGSDEADVLHRMAIAQTTFGSLSNIWADHRLSRALKLRTYQLAVCSTLTHSSEAWTLTAAVMRSINGFNSRCLHVITGQDTGTQVQPQCSTWCVRSDSGDCDISGTYCACLRAGWYVVP